MSQRTFSALAVLAFALVLASLAVRLATTDPTADAMRYRTMTTSLVETGGFHEDAIAREAPQIGEVENGHTHYFSPLWPILMAPFYVALGTPGFDVAVLTACAAALAVAFWATRDLFDEKSAFALLAALGPCLWWIIVQRGSEPIALALYTVTIWAVIRSIEPGRQSWIIAAGAAAALAYLARASVGWLFVLGGGAGFLWRVRFHRRRAVNTPYAIAIAIFAAAYVLWAARNLALFWDGTLAGFPHAVAADAVFEAKFALALEQPLRLLILILTKLLVGLVLLSPFLLLRRHSIRDQFRRLHDEKQSGLFLSWTVPLVTGSVVAAIFTIADAAPPSPVWNIDNLRYFIMAVPGIFWGGWRPTDLTTAAPFPNAVPQASDATIRKSSDEQTLI